MAVTKIIPPSSDFTSRDLDSWIVELRNRKNAAFPAWTDDNACHSSDTEVLTPNGWRHHDEVSPRDLIAAFDPKTEALTYVSPQNKHVGQVNGQMVRVVSKQTDFLVTTNHRMLYSRPPGREWQTSFAEELLGAGWFTFRNVPKPGAWEGETPSHFEIPKVCDVERKDGHSHPFSMPSRDFMEFLGYFVSDGGLCFADHHTAERVIFLRQKREPQRSKMRALLERLGWNYSESERDGFSVFTISNRCLRRWLADRCGSYAADRRLPQEVFSLSGDLLEVLRQAMLDGDGSRFPSGRSDRYYTKSGILADQVQHLLTLLGRRSIKTWSVGGGGIWYVSSCDRTTSTICSEGKNGRGSIRLVDYSGEVFCYQVPSGYFLTRRNGRVGISGNSNVGTILLELFAHTLDVLSFSQDQEFRETRVVWARLRTSMIGLGRNVSFVLPGPKAASADLLIAVADGLPRTSPIRVPKGTVVTNQEADVEFLLLAEAVIPANQTQVSGQSASHSEERTQAFVPTGVGGLEVLLSLSPLVDGSTVVTIGADVWTRVDTFFSSGPTSKHYRVDVDEDELGTIVFGDGTNGAIPTGVSATAAYKTGGGSKGNVEANKLTVFRDGSRFPSDVGEQVALTVRNPSGAAGGVDRMGVEEARVAIPASVRTAGLRSVTRDDFEDNARKVRGVARTLFLTSDDDPAIAENTGKLYVVPVGGGLPSAALKAEVTSLIDGTYPPTLTFTWTVNDPLLKIVSVSAKVYLARGVSQATARTAIESALDSFFSLVLADGSPNPAIDFGFTIRKTLMPVGAAAGEVAWSDVFNAIRDAKTTAGVQVLRKVEEDSVSPLDDVPLLDTEIPILGSISLFDGDAGGAAF